MWGIFVSLREFFVFDLNIFVFFDEVFVLGLGGGAFFMDDPQEER